MKVTNIKVKTASIPSRTAACQFLEREGYDMEWVPEQTLFYIHDVQKNQLHGIYSAEVTNFTLGVDPSAFMTALRKTLGTVGSQLHGAIEAKAKPKAKAEATA